MKYYCYNDVIFKKDGKDWWVFINDINDWAKCKGSQFVGQNSKYFLKAPKPNLLSKILMCRMSEEQVFEFLL